MNKNQRFNHKDIDEKQVTEFISSTSSFAFEMAVVKELRQLGLRVDHSANYSDPVTGLTRQYDIRAKITRRRLTVALSVECKNISKEFPLIVSCSPRLQRETYLSAFHGVIGGQTAQILKYSHMYRNHDQVGRAIEQFNSDHNKAKSRDEYYSKFAQSIQSAVADLSFIKRTYADALTPDRAIILPCLVIPDDLLWVVTYDDKGKMLGSPSKKEYISVYIGFQASHQPRGEGLYQYSFSHLELITLSGIKNFWSEHLSASADFDHLFEG